MDMHATMKRLFAIQNMQRPM